ncbi:MAG: methyltransferase domain-containing protein [Oscillatoriales cyanobacterium SM2_2_1]|nr:methyltransferase domain-containing protein [Oscillatoriales cyanobacterium SM2_2_1]
MKLLNLGCGSRYRRDWTNVDFQSYSSHVLSWNLKNGIPFDDGIFDLVYHSHVLEHFQKSEAKPFLSECCRVLKPNGVLRVVVPDLEEIVSSYLSVLSKLRNGEESLEPCYDWLMLEMFDQTTRNSSGGEMLRHLLQESIPNIQYVLERGGKEMIDIVNSKKSYFHDSLKEMEHFNLVSLLRKIRFVVKNPKEIKRFLIKLILGQEYEAWEIGKFRLSGEVHQWMYDEFSLGRLLSQSGFDQIKRVSPFDSSLSEWQNYNLDIECDEKGEIAVYKPNSLIMEGLKS